RLGLAVGAEDHLRIVLAAHLGQDVRAGLDGVAAGGLGRRDDFGGKRVSCSLGGESDDLGKEASVPCLGQNAQPLGEEQPFRLPRLLVAQRAQQLDGRVGEGGDLANHYSSPNRSSTSATSLASASSAPSPSTWMTIVSPIAAPSIIRPMIEVPQTRLPSFSTSVFASIWLARLTNFALARAWSPRWLVIVTWRLACPWLPVKPRPRPGSRWRRRYTCVPPRAPRRRRRGPASPCALPRAGSASAGSRQRSPRYSRSSSG